MRDDLDAHIKHIQLNKAFWRQCADNPNLYGVVDMPMYERSAHPSMISTRQSVAKLDNLQPRVSRNRRSSSEVQARRLSSDISIIEEINGSQQKYHKVIHARISNNRRGSSSTDAHIPHVKYTTAHPGYEPSIPNAESPQGSQLVPHLVKSAS
jgi:hypothetical protein